MPPTPLSEALISDRASLRHAAPSTTAAPKRGLWRALGPGLLTGASDDDPSGIATYSQAGAQFGYGLGWTMLLTFPLMAAVQEISARIGRVTGRGIAGNLRRHYARSLVVAIVGLVIFANTVNLAADLGAMAAAVNLLIGGNLHFYVLAIGAVSVLLEIFVRYERYVAVLKWLTLSLLAYVATVFVVGVPWGEATMRLLVPDIRLDADFIMMVVAVLGTTISPYLFFWQAEEEVEDQQQKRGARALRRAPEQAPRELHRIRIDTMIGMALSNLVALFIIWTTAATLHAHGVTNIETSAQAAEALRPIAGSFAFAVFAAGIVGTGLLALPVLAGSAAYALGEAMGWPVGLAHKWRHARAFYGTIAAATAIGIVLNLTPIDPVRALVWSAVVNGVCAAPIMALMMLLGARKDVMGRFVLPPTLRALGWIATIAMGVTAVVMIGSWMV
jgi:NRAMP (natural resistance-associated macrophage protein)-like metal ion transporter